MSERVAQVKEKKSLKSKGMGWEIPMAADPFDAVVNYYLQKEYQTGDSAWQAHLQENEKMIRDLGTEKRRSATFWEKLTHSFRKNNVYKVWDKIWARNKRLKESYFLPNERPVPYTWGERLLDMPNAAGVLTRTLLVAQVIREMKPKSVIEIGSGDGLNLFILASMFPEIRFTGLELTEGGVASSKEYQQQPELPGYIRNVPIDIQSTQAFKQIEFVQGSATKMSFADNAFDMVVSFVALEQMEPVRDAALREMARITKDCVAMVEPFKDFNASGLQREYILKVNYFQAAVEDMPQYGLKPVFICDDIPQKLNLNVGLVVCRKG